MPGNVLERTGLCPAAAGGNGAAQSAKAAGLRVVVNRALTAFDALGSWRLAEAGFPAGYAAARDALFLHLSPEDPGALCSAQRGPPARATQ
jgi:hypothetical protein